MDTQYKVSICIPVYNCEKYIGEAIGSVLKQTYKDFELLIIDNNSTDNTLFEVSKFNDKRIRIIKNEENIGLLKNWNKCLEYSTGEYIKILCADDILRIDSTEKMIRSFELVEDLGVVLGNFSIIDQNGKILKDYMYKKNKNCILPKGINTVKNALVKNNKFSCCPSLFMIKRSIIEDCGYFEALENGNIYSSDWEYVLRIVRNFNGYLINEPIFSIRIHNEQSGYRDKNQYFSFLSYINEFIVYICEKNDIKLSVLDKLIIDYRLSIDGIVEVYKKVKNKQHQNMKNDLSYMMKNFNFLSMIAAMLMIIFKMLQKAFLILYLKLSKRRRLNV